MEVERGDKREAQARAWAGALESGAGEVEREGERRCQRVDQEGRILRGCHVCAKSCASRARTP